MKAQETYFPQQCLKIDSIFFINLSNWMIKQHVQIDGKAVSLQHQEFFFEEVNKESAIHKTPLS